MAVPSGVAASSGPNGKPTSQIRITPPISALPGSGVNATSEIPQITFRLPPLLRRRGSVFLRGPLQPIDLQPQGHFESKPSLPLRTEAFHLGPQSLVFIF